MNAVPTLPDSVTRREAIKRASLLLGMAISPSLFTGTLHAQVSAANKSPDWKPIYLTAKQVEIAGAVADRIIPRTDTPGARDVGVPAFIDLLYGEFMTDQEKKTLVAGLLEVEAAAVATGKTSFSKLSPSMQDAQLKALAEASQSREKTFFHLIKELTVLGYFSSEPVGKTVLHYDPVPGRFDACIPLSEVGNVVWTR